MGSENIRRVKVPLSVEEIKEFFSNKELVYFINYKESELKGVVFLTYLSNLDLPAEIDFEGSTFEEKAELLKVYMTTRNILNSEVLRLNLAKLLLEHREIDCSDMFSRPIFNEKESKDFISSNKEALDRWERFLESSIVFSLCCAKELDEEFKVKEKFPVINDSQYTGANVVNLYSIPSFMEVFLSKGNRHELTYFGPQFEEYMFRGKNLYSYFFCDENLVFKLFMAHVTGSTSMEEIEKAGKEARAILGE